MYLSVSSKASATNTSAIKLCELQMYDSIYDKFFSYNKQTLNRHGTIHCQLIIIDTFEKSKLHTAVINNHD